MSHTGIRVTTQDELTIAYSQLANTAEGGTIILDPAEENFEIFLRDGPAEPGHVHIVGIDHATVDLIRLQNVSNITVSDLTVSSPDTSRAPFLTDLYCIGSSDIHIRDVQFMGDAEKMNSLGDPDRAEARSMGTIRNCEDVQVSHCHVEGYNHGLAVLESTGVSLLDNEITQLQGDGLRLAGVQDASIDGNYIHNFLGSTNDTNHNDMIQVWSTGTTLLTSNLTISNNTLLSGDGPASQAIFIGNERFGKFGESSHVYDGISITDNLIHNGSPNGISIAGAKNIEVSHNTVLWNPASETIINFGGEGESHAPKIILRGTTDAEVSNNIAPFVVTEVDTVSFGNGVVNYTDPGSPDYVSGHFVNAFSVGAASLEDLSLRADSSWLGMGSIDSQAILFTDEGFEPIILHGQDEIDSAHFWFDARLSVDESGQSDANNYEFLWKFEDGTEYSGVTISHTFDIPGTKAVELEVWQGGVLQASETREVEVQSKELLYFDFRQSQSDLSSYEADFETVFSEHDQSFHGLDLGSGHNFTIARSNDHIHNLSSFAIEMEVVLSSASSTGRILHFGGAFEASALLNGGIDFKLTTSEGQFIVSSEAGVLSVDDLTTLRFVYTGSDLLLEADGIVLDSTLASGETAPVSYYGLTVGAAWGQQANATVTSLKMAADVDTLNGFGVAVNARETEPQEVSPGVSDPVHLETEPFEPTLTPYDFEIVGTAGRDFDLRGTNASEFIRAGAGHDFWVEGRGGADFFEFKAGDEIVRIADFDRNEGDKIVLDSLEFFQELKQDYNKGRLDLRSSDGDLLRIDSITELTVDDVLFL